MSKAIPEKFCEGCQEWKPFTDFPKGRHRCDTCMKKYHSGYNKRDIKKTRKQGRKRSKNFYQKNKFRIAQDRKRRRLEKRIRHGDTG